MDRFRSILSVLNILVLICNVCSQDPNLCDRVMVPNTPKRPGSNGYRIRIDGQPTGYVPGQQYRVLLQSTAPVSFREFSLVALRQDEPTEGAGTFDILDRLTTELSRTCTAVTHSMRSSKTSVSVRWTAPPTGTGCVNFKAGVIQRKRVWFADDDDLTLELCEEVVAEAAATTVPPGALGNPDACCASPYLEAKYRMTFVSTWTPDTHPKDYPRGRGNHWSDLIGASHSPAYTIWDYGMFATEGVKMVAEWGSPYTLEREIKLEGNNVKTVITSRGLFPAYDTTRNMTAVFKTDSEHNLVSLLTMMGPSPDWCVGITRENLCTPECDWVERKEYSLQPWDAGTDGGVTYDAPNAPLDPPERIRLITSSDPDNERAPFYNANGDPIPPLGRVILERISVRNHSRGSQLPDTDGATPHGGNEGGMPPKVMPPKVMPVDPTMPPKVMPVDPTMPPKVMPVDPTMPPKVMVIDPTMPPKVMPITPLAIGGGSGQLRAWPAEQAGAEGSDITFYCEGPSTMELNWMYEGRMMLINSGKYSSVQTVEGDLTTSSLTIRDAQIADSGSYNCIHGSMEFSVILRIHQGTETTAAPMPTKRLGGQPEDCMLSEWGDWSECSKSCGKGRMTRQRMVKRRPRRGGQKCGRTKESKSCNLGRCSSRRTDRDCKMGAWGDWTACSVTCGEGTQFRMRDVARRSRGNGAPCGALKEMRVCQAYVCE